MLIPQFSLRWMLSVTAAIAVVFLVMGWAIRGSAWAVGVSAAVVTLVLVGLVYAAMFGIVWLISLIGQAASPRGQDQSRAEDLSPKGKP